MWFRFVQMRYFKLSDHVPGVHQRSSTWVAAHHACTRGISVERHAVEKRCAEFESSLWLPDAFVWLIHLSIAVPSEERLEWKVFTRRMRTASRKGSQDRTKWRLRKGIALFLDCHLLEQAAKCCVMGPVGGSIATRLHKSECKNPTIL
jgi:hypothetical protein